MWTARPKAKARDAVHIVFAGEKIRPDYACETPDVLESDESTAFRILDLEALVRMKLTSFHLRDQVQLLDLLEVGLIDEGWCERVPEELAERLREVIKSRDREA